MHLSLNWIKDFLKNNITLTAEELGDLITLKTAEIEGFNDEAHNFENMVVGQIIEVKPHPNADKLKICITDIGDKKVQIVCGGSNVENGLKVACTLPGSRVKWHGEGDLITIEAAQVRGEDSYGMIAAAEEIGLGQSEGNQIMNLNYLDAAPGTPLAEALQKADIVYEIDNKSLTHRPDLWGHLGFAREIATITDNEFTLPSPQVEIPSKGKEISLKVTDKEILQRWNSVIIEGITVGPSPLWMQSRLQSCGINPVNNLVDVTNYVMLEIGQPMHCYDYDILGTDKLEIRFAKPGETLETIDHKQRELHTEDPILFAGKPTMLLGIMGGANSEVTEATSTILLEAGNWDPTIIRKTSTRNGLRTDASQRFEKSLDSNLTELAIKRALEIILEICPEAKIAGPITDIWNKKPEIITIDLDPERVRKYIGADISDDQIKNILQSLGYTLENWRITVPSHRATKDIGIEVDLIEEVARIYGYDQIEATLPELPAKMPHLNLHRERQHQARQILASFGLSEVLNYSFYGKQDLEQCFLEEEKHIKLKNYLSEEQTHMRVSLLPNLLKNVHLNLKNFSEFSIYELGRIYPEIGEFFPAEEEQIGLVVVGKDSFLQLKGILQEFFEQFSHQQYTFERNDNPPAQAHPNKAGHFLDENETLAEIFAVHPLILENYDIDAEVAYAEINFGRLAHDETFIPSFDTLPKFPDTSFDLSILVNKKTPAAELKQTLAETSELIHSVELFDVYEGEHIPADKKALAYTITLRADRTLTDQETTEVQQNCIANIQKIGGEVRG